MDAGPDHGRLITNEDRGRRRGPGPTDAYVWRLNQIPPGPVEKLTPSPQTATVLPVLVTSTAP